MQTMTTAALAGVLLLATSCSKSSDKKDTPTAAPNPTTPAAEAPAPEKPAPAPSDGVKRYQVESGIVEYKVSGTQTGTEKLTFDDWGWKEATHTQVELDIAGHKRKENSMALLSREYTHTFDVDKRTGLRVADAAGVLVERAQKAGQDMTDVGTAMLLSMGGTKISTKQVAGHECDVYEAKGLGTTVCLYKGLTLESKTVTGPVTIEKVAIKAEFDVPVPAATFEVPADVTFRDIKSPLSRPNP